MDNRKFSIVFAVLAILELTTMITGWPIRWLTKPSIMIALIGYAALNFSSYWPKYLRSIFLFALLFALAGDIFLLSEENFIYGLSSFLLMQILYCICFSHGGFRFSVSRLTLSTLIIIWTAVMLTMLWPYVGDMLIPVIVYSSAIGVMALIAINRKTSRGYTYVLVGSLFFVISDSILAINLFHEKINLPGWTVMFTYIIAQFLIVMGFTSYLQGDKALN